MKSERTQSGSKAWLWLFVIALVVIIYLPTLRWLVLNWLGNPYYTHGVLIAPISAFLAWRLYSAQAAEKKRYSEGGAFGAGLFVAGTGLLLHLVALSRYLYLVSGVSIAITVSGLLLALRGVDFLRQQAFPIAFLLLMVPLPWLESGSPALARWVAATTGHMAERLGMAVVVDGARVDLPNTALVVGAPCSGVNSLAALMTMAILYAYLLRGPIASRIALVAMAFPVALAANVVRVLLLVGLAYHASVDVAMRYFHDWSSPLLFLMALGLLALVGKWFRCEGIRTDII